jgi:cytochrome P450
MTQWMLDRSADQNFSVEVFAKAQLGLVFAAIHTTSLTTTNILYTLGATPEYIGPLREEIRSVIAEHDGTFTAKALQQMEKLDSYMKEVNRVYTPGLSKSCLNHFTHISSNSISLLQPPRPQRHHPL